VETSRPEADQSKSMKFRGRVLESVFASPIYRQVVASVIEKEWGSSRVNRKTATPAEKTNDENREIVPEEEQDTGRRES